MDEDTPSPSQEVMSASAKSTRKLACVLCKQRKIKCDRQSPCSNCTRARTPCVPIGTPRPRRRRFAERELLQRLRHYEDLLRQNDIAFEPMHGPSTRSIQSQVKDLHIEHDHDLHGENDHEEDSTDNAQTPGPVNFWRVVHGKTGASDDDDDYSEDDPDIASIHADLGNHKVRAGLVRRAWDHLYTSDDLLLLGTQHSDLKLAAFHPQTAHIFKIWQIYLDNVNPLLKVTHIPTLQPRIINAISDLGKIDPVLEALMFSVYCIAIGSLDNDECFQQFDSTRDELLTTYRFGCQQALLNCGVLRNDDRESLTAFFLYLFSIRPDTHPRALSSMLGSAVRIAQRIGLPSESIHVKHPPLEAEMRRRLWWALVIFDDRVCETSHYVVPSLPHGWVCRTPLNINDYELMPETKTLPKSHDRPTEGLYACIRSQVADLTRRGVSSVDLINPGLNAGKDGSSATAQRAEALFRWAKEIEDNCFTLCDPTDRLHFMTVWSIRGYVAKIRLMDHYSRFVNASTPQTPQLRSDATGYALEILECNTKLSHTPLVKGFQWLVNFHFPFPAFIHVIADIRNDPSGPNVDRAWDIMSDNWRDRFFTEKLDGSVLFKIFSGHCLKAWAACEAAAQRSGQALKETPHIILDIQKKVQDLALINAQKAELNQPPSLSEGGSDEFDFSSMPTPENFGIPGMPFLLGIQDKGGPGLFDFLDQSAQDQSAASTVSPPAWPMAAFEVERAHRW